MIKEKNIDINIYIVFVKFVLIFKFIFIYLLHVLFELKIKGIFRKQKVSPKVLKEVIIFLFFLRKKKILKLEITIKLLLRKQFES